MVEPNRLRDAAVPNRYRTDVVPDGGAARDRAPDRAPSTAARGRGRAGRSRRILVGALVLAAVSVPFLFAPQLSLQELALGLICIGLGVALTVAVRSVLRDNVRRIQGSRTAAAGALLGIPHAALFGAAGLGLVAFGLALVAVAIGLL